jgi:predicted small secreted protein
MYQTILAFIGIGASLLLTACNTMEGLGKDIQKGGERIEHSAEKNK